MSETDDATDDTTEQTDEARAVDEWIADITDSLDDALREAGKLLAGWPDDPEGTIPTMRDARQRARVERVTAALRAARGRVGEAGRA